jgi:hypothetical protein
LSKKSKEGASIQGVTMRVSEYYKLQRTQPTLDFVDVDVEDDTSVFVDPRALRLLPDEWGNECVSLVQNFFRAVLRAIKENNDELGYSLLSALREPNETHLGLSKGISRGRGIGRQSARVVWEALSKSEAAKSGLLEELEDSILMIEGISSDIISDITTNIIRRPLILYTQEKAKHYGIPLIPDVNSGPLWDPEKTRWYTSFASMPVVDDKKLILVPKSIVRTRMEYDVGKYYRNYLLERLREIELSANTELVYLLKDGKTKKVDKKAVKEKFGSGKATIVKETRNHPEILEKYRKDKLNNYQPPLDHFGISLAEGTPQPEWGNLLQALLGIPAGKENFSKYENAIEALLSALFYPSLTNPVKQLPIHEGRKRIDLTYTNVASHGFFYWLSMHYSASHIFVECKNYGKEIGNPELDQIASRFSPSRGQFGIITCRSFENKDLFAQRCKDTTNDNRGFVIALDDEDVSALVDEVKASSSHVNFNILKTKFDHLIF